MDFFNIGAGELLVLMLLALLLFGPEEALQAARSLGQTLRQWQQSWQQVAALLQRDLLEAEGANRPDPYASAPASPPPETEVSDHPAEASLADDHA